MIYDIISLFGGIGLFIDTHSKDTMEKSIIEYLTITKDELYNAIEKASISACNDKWFNGDIFDNLINDFITQHISDKQIDKILFFHLGRRLNSAAHIVCGNTLFDLLTTKNEFSNFLAQHKVYFENNNGHLDLYYNDNKKSLDNTYEAHIPYLRSRLGYNSGREDYCFNGFAFKDLLYKNSYARKLEDVPEFIGVLATFLKDRTIGSDYYEQSTYYCYEYLIPIEIALFDDNEKMSLSDKKIYIVNQVIHRLHDYYYSNSKYMYDDDNPILRLGDFCTMDAKYYVAKEIITTEMLR